MFRKKWVLAHPFIAVKAFNCAVRSRFVTDSLEKNQLLKDGNGGQLDAFRHAYWMALLTVQFSAKKLFDLEKCMSKEIIQIGKRVYKRMVFEPTP